MSKTIMKVMGMDGQVELLPDRVIIHREGIFNMIKFGLNSTREIPLGAISEIMFRPAKFQFGTIEFVRSGRSTDERSRSKNSIVKFSKKQNAEFLTLKEKTFDLMDKYSRKPQ